MVKEPEKKRDDTDDAFFAALRKGDVSGAYYFFGVENYAKQKAIEGVKGLLSAACAEMNYTRLQSPAADDLISACEPVPFFDERRIVVSDPVPLKEDRERIAAWLPSLPPATILIFNDPGTPHPNSLIFAALKKAGRAVWFAEYEPNRAVAFVCKRAAENNISIDRFAATELVHMIGTDLYDLLNAVLKVGAYTGYGVDVGVSHLKACLSPNTEYEIMEVTDLLLSGKKKEALTIIQGLLAKNESPMGIAAYMLSRLRSIRETIGCLDCGLTDQAVIAKRLGKSPGAAYYLIRDAKRMGKAKADKAILDFGNVNYMQVSGLGNEKDLLLKAFLNDF